MGWELWRSAQTTPRGEWLHGGRITPGICGAAGSWRALSMAPRWLAQPRHGATHTLLRWPPRSRRIAGKSSLLWGLPRSAIHGTLNGLEAGELGRPDLGAASPADLDSFFDCKQEAKLALQAAKGLQVSGSAWGGAGWGWQGPPANDCRRAWFLSGIFIQARASTTWVHVVCCLFPAGGG